VPNVNLFITQFITLSFLCLQDGDCNFYYVWHTGAACPPHKSTDCSVMHDGLFYDLNPLSDLMANQVVVKTEMKVKFLLNVCHSVVFGKGASCQYTSAACLINMSNPNPSTRCALVTVLLVWCSRFGGLVVSMLASGTQVRGFKPGRNRCIFQAKKLACLPSEGK
jgi:hypothetical protein